MKPALYSPSRYIHILTQLLDEAGKDPTPVLKAFQQDLVVPVDAIGSPASVLHNVLGTLIKLGIA